MTDLQDLARRAGMLQCNTLTGEEAMFTGPLDNDGAMTETMLARFSALVAEECAKKVDGLLAFNEDDPAETACAAIRAAFPMPKE